MLSLTPLPTLDAPDVVQDRCEDAGYYLRRAQEESIAAIRSVDARAAESHAGMATLYSARSLAIIAQFDDEGHAGPGL